MNVSRLHYPNAGASPPRLPCLHEKFHTHTHICVHKDANTYRGRVFKGIYEGLIDPVPKPVPSGLAFMRELSSQDIDNYGYNSTAQVFAILCMYMYAYVCKYVSIACHSVAGLFAIYVYVCIYVCMYAQLSQRIRNIYMYVFQPDADSITDALLETPALHIYPKILSQVLFDSASDVQGTIFSGSSYIYVYMFASVHM
jgi:hypothetical protein